MKTKATVGLMGSTQIEHVAKVLEGRYDVILEPEWSGNPLIDSVRFLQFLSKVDVVYIVFVSSTSTRYKLTKLLKKKLLLHWIGTDAYRALQDPGAYSDAQRYADCHVSCFEPISEELRSVGIETDVIPIVPFNIDLSISKTPDEHNVLVYLPEWRKEWYGYPTIKEVSERMPDLSFSIVANSDESLFDSPNVKMLGTLSHEEMDALYDDVSIVLRFITHDGYAMSIIEGLAKGKEAVWNYPHPYSHHAKNADEIVEALTAICANKPTANLDGANYIKDNLNLEAIRELTYKKIDGLLDS